MWGIFARQDGLPQGIEGAYPTERFECDEVVLRKL